MPRSRKTSKSDENKDTPDDIHVTTASQVLETLLTSPPARKIGKTKGDGAFSIGQGGIRYNLGADGHTKNYEQASNDVVRAQAAANLGLVVSPLSTSSALFYVKPEEYQKQLAEAHRLKKEKMGSKKNSCKNCVIL